MIATKGLVVAGLALSLATTIAALSLDVALIKTANELGDSRAAIAQLAAWQPVEGGSLTLGRGDIVGRLGPTGQRVTQLQDIPRHVQNAFIAAEDKSFWTNAGLDIPAMARAALQNAQHPNRRLAGASTITQQLAKIGLLNGNTRTLKRKLQQVVLALRITQAIPKAEILRLYLNRVYLGRSWVGIAEAAQGFFGKTPAQLTLAEAATLAGLARNPSANDPIRHPGQAARRKAEVLAAMLRNRLITKPEHETALAETVIASHHNRRQTALATQRPAGLGWATDLARAELKGPTGSNDLKPGTKVTLTVAPPLQTATTLALQYGLMRWETDRRGWHGTLAKNTLRAGPTETAHANIPPAALAQLGRTNWALTCAPGCPDWARPALVLESGPARLVLANEQTIFRVAPEDFAWITGSATTAAAKFRRGDIILAGQPYETGKGAVAQPTELNGSAVALDITDGRILAITGGLHWSPGGLNRATTSRRSPGSAFKPFVYLAALDRGFTPDTTVFDLPIAIPDGNRIWSPANDDNRWLGPIPLSRALAESRNAPAVRMLWQLGPDTVSEVAKSFGIYAAITTPSAALGTQETTNLALTSAYATLAANGVKHPPHITLQPPKDPAIQITTAANARILVDMLEGVLEPGGTASRLTSFATALRQRGLVVAGKTGTSSDFKDAWLVGFAGAIAVGIHVGYDKPRPMGPNAFGATVAGPIWADILRAADREGLLQPKRRTP